MLAQLTHTTYNLLLYQPMMLWLYDTDIRGFIAMLLLLSNPLSYPG